MSEEETEVDPQQPPGATSNQTEVPAEPPELAAFSLPLQVVG